MQEGNRQKISRGERCEVKMARRINDLPDDVTRHIATFLSAQKAFHFSTTCKKFSNLFSIVLDLEFDEEAENQENLTGFLDGILALPVTETRIRKFSLKCQNVLDPAHINSCLVHVVKLGVMDIELCVNRQNGHSLPLELFNCRTVVNMELGEGFVISALPNNASLPALETLVLNEIRFQALDGDDCAFEALLSASNVLKKLVIDDLSWETWNWAGIVSSPTLETLTIHRDFSQTFKGPSFQGITFDTPNLVYLDYWDFVPDAYPIVNLDSLVKAELNLQVWVDREFYSEFPYDGDDLSSNPTNLIQGIRNVEILDLSTSSSFFTFYQFREAIPVFRNLHTLKLYHDEPMEYCLWILPILLNRTPNLKTLIIEGELHYVDEGDYLCECLSGYTCLLSCPVEVLEIALLNYGTLGELEQIKHFLGKLSRLKLLKVHIGDGISGTEKLSLLTELRMLPRASAVCMIQIVDY